MAFPGIFVVASVTVATVSPQARAALRRGVVYGLAGAITAGETIAQAAQSAVADQREAAKQDASNGHS